MSRFTKGDCGLRMVFLLVPLFLVQGVAQAQESEQASKDGFEDLEEVVAVGTRREPRSATDSPVPIDVVSGDDFINQGGNDLSDLLRNVVPSYNVNTQPISDAATIVRPANLRGLAPDQTLVLVNGKRRHRAAVIYWIGNGVASGAQGPDISAIPSLALKQVEVLRDGAAAQYGSDAIAGVMNFILKDNPEGSTYELKTGQFAEGDGQSTYFSGNIGMPLGKNGFSNVTFEYGNSDPTDRSTQRDDAAALIANGNTAVANPAQVWGQPEVEGDFKLFVNMGGDLGGGTELYTHANYASKKVDGGFYFRNPNTRGGVFGVSVGISGFDANGDAITAPVDVNGNPTIDIYDDNNNLTVGSGLDGTLHHRLVGDVTDNLTGGCPVAGTFGGATAGLPVEDEAGLQAVLNNSDCFAFNERFPGGFTPRFGGDVRDLAFTTGVRGETSGGMMWDLSFAYGTNEVDYFIYNTVNASLGPNTPTSFDPGSYTQNDTNLNFDISYPVPVGAFHSDLNIAAGFEYRKEEFEVGIGEESSYIQGPLFTQGFSGSSNGFPGFDALTTGSWDRSNIAMYVDFEADVTEKLLLGFALRWEDFNDFGTTTNYKLSGHYQASDTFAMRSTYSTGFRAPTPGQQNAFNVTTQFTNGLLINNGTIPSTNPVAATRGGIPLEPEESTNFTLGTILTLGAVDLTIDYFSIDLENRLTLSQAFTLTQAETDALVASGVNFAENLGAFLFFINGLETETTGIDIVASWDAQLFGGNTDFSFAYNQTDTTVSRSSIAVVNGALSDGNIQELEDGLPENRWNFTANHLQGDWRYLGRISYYDEHYDNNDGYTFEDITIVDAEVAYRWDEKYSVTFGAQNLLDEYPEESPIRGGSGNTYSQLAPSGFGGRFMYLRFRVDLF